MQSLKEYWNHRYREITLQESGNTGYSLRYNRWYYRAKERVLRETLSRLRIEADGRTVADIGSGTGFLIDFFRGRNAVYILALDISQRSIDRLRQRYRSEPNIQLECLDIAHVSRITNRDFHVVAVYDLMYLIVEESDFIKAMQNICSLVAQDGYVLIVDMFPPAVVTLADYIVCRSFEAYRRILGSHGFEILDVIPQFFLFNRSRIGLVLRTIMNLFPWMVYFIDKIALAAGISGDGNRSGASFKLMVACRRHARHTSA